MFNSWFNPSGYKDFSFKIQRISLQKPRGVLVSSAVVYVLICSIKVNPACCPKLWFCSLKYLYAKIGAYDYHLFYTYWDRCWKESHFFQRTEVGIYDIGVDKFR